MPTSPEQKHTEEPAQLLDAMFEPIEACALQKIVPKFSSTADSGFRGLAGFPFSSVVGLRCLLIFSSVLLRIPSW